MAGTNRVRKLLGKLREAMTDNAPPAAPGSGLGHNIALNLRRLRYEVMNEDRVSQGLPPLPVPTDEELLAEIAADRERWEGMTLVERLLTEIRDNESENVSEVRR